MDIFSSMVFVCGPYNQSAAQEHQKCSCTYFYTQRIYSRKGCNYSRRFISFIENKLTSVVFNGKF